MLLTVDQIAAAAAAILAPLSPYIAEGGKKFAAKAGEAAWDQAQKVWSFLSDSGKTKPDLAPEMKALAKNPESPNYRAALAETLTEHFRANPDIIPELVKLLGQHPRVQEIIASGGSVEDAIQKMTSDGHQRIESRRGGSIKGVRQEM